MASNLTINPKRLWDQIMETAQFGATPKGGIKRLTVALDVTADLEHRGRRLAAWLRGDPKKAAVSAATVTLWP